MGVFVERGQIDWSSRQGDKYNGPFWLLLPQGSQARQVGLAVRVFVTFSPVPMWVHLLEAQGHCVLGGFTPQLSARLLNGEVTSEFGVRGLRHNSHGHLSRRV